MKESSEPLNVKNFAVIHNSFSRNIVPLRLLCIYLLSSNVRRTHFLTRITYERDPSFPFSFFNCNRKTQKEEEEEEKKSDVEMENKNKNAWKYRGATKVPLSDCD